MSLQPLNWILPAAAVFSISVVMQGATLGDEISELKINRSCDGMGISGVCTASLEFSVLRKNYVNFMKLRASPVFVTLIKNEPDGTSTEIKCPDFYVNSRSFHGGIVTFTCYDRMAFADSIKFYEKDFYLETSTNGTPDVARYTSGEELFGLICTKLGAAGTGDFGGVWDAVSKYPTDSVIGQTLSQVMQSMSQVMCGTFFISNDNKLIFCRFDMKCNIGGNVSDYSEPDIGDTLTVGKYKITSSNGRETDYTTDENGVIINVSGGNITHEKSAELVGSAVCGKTYTYGSVENIILGWLPQINSNITFKGGGDLKINNISLVISSCGIIGSISANEAGGNEIADYMGRLTLDVEKSLKSGDKIGTSTIFTKYQGLVHVDSEEYEKYLGGD